MSHQKQCHVLLQEDRQADILHIAETLMVQGEVTCPDITTIPPRCCQTVASPTSKGWEAHTTQANPKSARTGAAVFIAMDYALTRVSCFTPVASVTAQCKAQLC